MSQTGLLMILVIFAVDTSKAQNGPFGYENRRIISEKKFHVQYEEVVINKSVEEVWAEVAGNFGTAGEISKSTNSSYSLSPGKLSGLGAERYLNIDFQGKTVEAKERIIEFKESTDHNEFTYDVYESQGSPVQVKVHNTWVVRKGADGKTYLGTVFIYRAKFAPLTGIIGKKIEQSGSLRNGVLSYKHYLETGEKKVAPEKLNLLYPLQ